MGVYEADLERSAAIQHMHQAYHHLSSIVVDRSHGTARYSKEHMHVLRATYVKLLELRDGILAFDEEARRRGNG